MRPLRSLMSVSPCPKWGIAGPVATGSSPEPRQPEVGVRREQQESSRSLSAPRRPFVFVKHTHTLAPSSDQTSFQRSMPCAADDRAKVWNMITLAMCMWSTIIHVPPFATDLILSIDAIADSDWISV